MNKLIFSLLLTSSALSTSAFCAQLPPIVQLVKKTLEQKNFLTSPECTDYLYTPDFESDVDSIDVIEKHGGSCSGDPQIQHRLFTVNVNKKHTKWNRILMPQKMEISYHFQLRDIRVLFAAAKTRGCKIPFTDTDSLNL